MEIVRKAELKCAYHVIVAEVLNFGMALYRGWIAGLLKERGRGMRGGTETWSR
jgi:hypothetical protein